MRARPDAPVAPPGRRLTRLVALPLAALALAACQAGPELPRAERALPAEMAPVMAAPVDPDACWTQARIVGPDGQAEDRLFAVPCPAVLDAAFWSSVQRALAVRGHYAGPVTGTADAPTAEAVRRFQAPLGLDSGVLSLDAARMLGLLPWPRGAAEAG